MKTEEMKPALSAIDLQLAFERFSQETSKLESAYNSLKKRFQKLQIELKQTSHSLKSVTEHMAQGLLFISLEGTILLYNPMAEEILQTKASQVLHTRFWDHFSDTTFDFSLKEALEKANAPAFSHFTIKSNKIGHQEIELSSTLIKEGLQTGYLFMLRDITEIRALQKENQLNDRLKELGEMAASVAHEIRNPLAGIEGFASLLERDLEDTPDLQQMATYIAQGSQTLNRLVTNILNYSRPITLQKKFIELKPFIDSLFKMIKVDSKYSQVQFKDHILPDNLQFSADQELLRSLFLNLFINGAQASNYQGKIEVRAKKDNHMIIIDIEDQGCGIPSENLEKIFSPFFTTKQEGNGFGLSEVYKIIKAHHGSIQVSSKKNIGSIFTIELPLS